jgi:hypothetical protein
VKTVLSDIEQKLVEFNNMENANIKLRSMIEFNTEKNASYSVTERIRGNKKSSNRIRSKEIEVKKDSDSLLELIK